MTHTLQRLGTVESLSEDYVILMIVAFGFNDYIGHEQKLQEFLRIAQRHNPKNLGNHHVGTIYTLPVEEVIKTASYMGHVVFDNPQAVTQVLRELKEADPGISVVVSGLTDSVNECIRNAGLKRHTIELSLGIWGNTKKLPPRDILEVTTMEGHSYVSHLLVSSMVGQIRAGTKTPEDAAKVLARNNLCGEFNPARGAKLLAAMAEKMP